MKTVILQENAFYSIADKTEQEEEDYKRKKLVLSVWIDIVL